MFPEESDLNQPEPTPVAVAPLVSAPAPRPVRRNRGNFAKAALLTAAIGASAAGGGVAGATAALRWWAPEPTTPSTTAAVVMAQPAAQTFQTENIAGAVYSLVGPSVVEITASQTNVRFGGSSSGTGFVVNTSGLILTNAHVVGDADTITVTFSDGTEREAQVLGTDVGHDLAVLKVDLPAGVPAVTLGDSDNVEVGETVIAIGSPFGLEQTVTQGIVSAVNRTWWPGTGPAQRGLIQTDAPINPGNSGGPLLNAQGEVIGINSMIESPVSGSVGVGFAISINTAKTLLPQLEAGEELESVWLGISGGDVDATVAERENLAVDSGVLVAEVVVDSPADDAGLQAGDVITALDGKTVADMVDLTGELSLHQPGDTVEITVDRSGQQESLQATLEVWPETLP